ncbi:hypothetical protein Tco_0211054 [Tanacetum coccineum]
MIRFIIISCVGNHSKDEITMDVLEWRIEELQLAHEVCSAKIPCVFSRSGGAKRMLARTCEEITIKLAQERPETTCLNNLVKSIP